MAKSYQAVYEQGQLHWLDESPPIQKARVLVTVLDAAPTQNAARAEQLRQCLDQTRGAWGKVTDTAELDAAIKAMRDEWQRPWESAEITVDE